MISDAERAALVRRVGGRGGRALVVGSDDHVLPDAVQATDLDAVEGAYDTVVVLGALPPARTLAQRLCPGALVAVLTAGGLPPGYSWFVPIGSWRLGERSLVLLRRPWE